MSEIEIEGLENLEKLIANEIKGELNDLPLKKETIKDSDIPKTNKINIDPKLERAYNVRASVKNVEDILQSYTLASANFTNNCPYKVEYNLAYGDGHRNVLDLYWPNNSADSPMVMFIHGGYWRDLSKNDFSHIAKGFLDHNYSVAIPSYSLCPQASIPQIINEIRKACLYLWRRHNRSILVIGHSAGAHLAANLLTTDWQQIEPYAPENLVTKALLISGLYDLSPLLKTSINEDLNLDEQTSHQSSPINQVIDTNRQVEIVVGQKDPKTFISQSKKLYDVWHLLGVDVHYEMIDGVNHYSIIDPLSDPSSAMVKKIMDLQYREPHKIKAVPEQSIEDRVKKKLQKNHQESQDEDEIIENENPKPNPTNDIYDDLTKIKGINSELAHKLYEVGIKSFEQLSLLNEQNSPIFERIIERKGFVKKYNIVEQAKALNKKQSGEDDRSIFHSFYKRKSTKYEGPIKQDDLTLINGIGPKYKERLNSVGIHNFKHLSVISHEEATILDRQLDLNGRIFIDDWMGQAQAMLDKND